MGYGRPEANFIFRRPFPERMRRKGRPASTRRPPALKRRAGRKRLGARGIMAVDIARVRSGIAIKLTPSSLFCKKLSTGRPFLQNPAMTTTLASIPGLPKASRLLLRPPASFFGPRGGPNRTGRPGRNGGKRGREKGCRARRPRARKGGPSEMGIELSGTVIRGNSTNKEFVSIGDRE